MKAALFSVNSPRRKGHRTSLKEIISCHPGHLALSKITTEGHVTFSEKKHMPCVLNSIEREK